ncbi:hypothetical protein [Synechococcus sp. N5]|uniref:hypothetical protein n=1 Tax=Synechococcus sp. N5 TaxID=2575515 RepID=UPI0014835781|nr:hypothetical protein [Synechococcus sp. N5]
MPSNVVSTKSFSIVLAIRLWTAMMFSDSDATHRAGCGSRVARGIFRGSMP